MQRTISIFCALTFAVGACSEDESGSGIGRRPVSIDDVERPVLVNVAFSEVYATPVAAADREVELLNTGTSNADVTGFSVCAADLCDPVIVTDIAPGAREVIAVPTLDLAAGVGEAALVDADGVVHAYVAWGADPASVGSSLAAAAAVTGATEAGLFVRLPYPFPSSLDVAIAWEGTEAGCALPSSGTAATIDAALCPAATSPALEITELLPWTPEPDDGDENTIESGDSWVELHNIAGEPLNMYGVRVCHMPQCVGFAAGTFLADGAYLLVHFGVEDTGLSGTENDLFAPDVAPVRATGEVVVLSPGSADVTDALTYQSFVRYGRTAGRLSDSAVVAGLWPEALASAREVRIAGESLSHDLTSDVTAESWNTTAPTPRAANTDISPGTDVWTSCSWPRPWNPASPSALVIRQIALTTPATLLIENRSDVDLILNDVVLALDTATLALSAALLNPLPAGAFLQVELDPGLTPDGCADTADLCFAGAALLSTGEAALLLDDGMTPIALQYVRWGAGTATRAADAEANNLWPLAECALPELLADTAFTLTAGADGQSPPDYQ